VGQNYNKDVFKRIFREHWAEFQSLTPEYQTEYYDGVIKKMLGCGDPENGFMSYRCVHCGERKKVPFSCKSSFCLSCAKIYTDKWVDYIGRTLFSGVNYRHVVLTVPERLRGRFNSRQGGTDLLSELMKAGHAFFQDVISCWLKEEVEVGSVVVLQTAGRSGSYNPHLHIICTSGGMTKDGRWQEFSYIDFNLLHRKWQYHLLKMLRENIRSKEMDDEIDRCYKDYPNGFVAYIEKGEVPEGGRGLAYYLAKYVVSPPISLKRIKRYDGQNVSYWYNDHASGKRMEAEVKALDFIGLILWNTCDLSGVTGQRKAHRFQERDE
jgi:hypothetical protein